MTQRLTLDFETSSTVDLRVAGVQAYAEHPDTRITVLCYAIGGEPVETVIDGKVPDRFALAVRSGSVVVAHNYLFEFNIYHHKLVPLGWPPIPLEQWSCTMARAYVAGYPGALELAGKAAKLAITKDASARDLMLRMARPRTLVPLTWWHETSPEHFARLCDYCVKDVESERLLDDAVPELSPRERLIFEADHRLNQRGLQIDLTLVDRLAELAEAARSDVIHKLVQTTNGQITTPNQVAKIRAWLGFHQINLPDLKRDTVRGALAIPTLTGAPRSVLQARLDASRASTAKLAAIKAAVSPDGRVRGCFQYYGANRTGRWAGRRVQPQNLYRGSIKDIPMAINLALQPDTEAGDLAMLFEDSALGVIASCLRGCIVARPGHKLVILDLAQIEARVLAWLAHEPAALACFVRGDDIYTETARSVGSGSRQLGKVLVLACGFGMGPTKFQSTAAGYGVQLDEDQCREMVWAWREANPNIVNYWWRCERAMHQVCRAAPGTEIAVNNLMFIRRQGAVLIRLPSGRSLVYRQPSIQWNPDNRKHQFCYMGSGGGGWNLQRAWPGKIVENIVQAVARDVLAESMIELDQQNVPLIATVHDELIAEVREDTPDAVDFTCAQMRRVMRTSPDWARDLPMNTTEHSGSRYRKG